MRFLITGVTGFIGSNLALFLLESGHDVIATYRSTSNFEKCDGLRDKITWVNINND